MAGHWAVGVAAALVAAWPSLAVAASRTWDAGGVNALASNPTNWVGDVAPVAADDIVLDATSHKAMTWNMTNMPVASWTQVGYLGTVTVATVYGTTGFTNLSIAGDCVISNGVWTPDTDTTTGKYRLSVTVNGNLTIGPNAIVDAAGKGFRIGPGRGANAVGGTHGGKGASKGGSVDIPGLCYGSIVAPTNLGSGGTLGTGGGAIRMQVGGRLRVEGIIRATGSASSEGTGSGGSVYLIAGELTGAGAIRANGGDASNHSPGGGGRVAVVLTNAAADFSAFSGTIEAISGQKAGNAYGAGPGTVYLETCSEGSGRGSLIVNAGGLSPVGRTGFSEIEASTVAFGRITLTNCVTLVLGTNNTVIATNTLLTGDANHCSNGIAISGGTLIVLDGFAFSNLFIHCNTEDSAFNPAVSLAVRTNGALVVDRPHLFQGDLIVAAGGILTHSANTSAGNKGLDLTVQGDMLVETGGSVNAVGKGFPAATGPGKGTGAVGGTHGGLGGPKQAGQYPGPCYGSIVAPTQLGSGGTLASGGGSIRIQVAGQLRVDGSVTANGGTASEGQGSGGSVYLTVGELAGAGTVQANGGNTAGHSPGGGGRVALVVTNAGADFTAFAGTIEAAAGAYLPALTDAKLAGAGTVYLRTASQGSSDGVLIVDNKNMSNVQRTEITSNVTDTAVGHVHLQRKGWLRVNTNQVLTVGGVWSNSASFTAESGSAVVFTGGSVTSTVYGTNLFMGFVCTNAGDKVFLFEAGKTNAIAAGGRLLLAGEAGATNLLLKSTLDGMDWMLRVDPSVEQAIEHADVRNSDARGGAEVSAMNSRDSGSNQNWRFITVGGGETNTWTGNSNTVWSARENWDRDRSPVADDVIVIPGGCSRYPVVDGTARTLAGLTIGDEASLSLNGHDLTVSGDTVLAGALVCAGLETVTFAKTLTLSGSVTAMGTETFILGTNADFTGGAFHPALSTVVLAGEGAQVVDLADLTFNRIRVDPSVGPLAFAGGFAATELRCEAATGTRSLTVQQGTTVTLRDLVLLGSAATTNIMLRSSSSGQKWNLAVSGYRSVRGVDVRDSDAGGGLPIPAVSSKDSGSNPNWIFDATWSTWLGTSGNSFHTAANWSPAGVPDATARVWVDTTNRMVVTGAVTVLDLTVGGGVGASSVTVSAPVTVMEDIMILSQGTLALDRPSVVSNSIVVLSGGTLTHSGNTSAEANKLDVTVHGNVGVDVGGSVDAVGKGYSGGVGPGRGTGAVGGTYGGQGGPKQAGNYPGPCYGSIVAPTNLGSGGSFTAGGGAILMRIAGQLRVDGDVRANGAVPAWEGSGSGGSIFLTAGALTGSGTLRANGGNVPGHSPGGGGRVSLVLTGSGAGFSGFVGVAEAVGGVLLPGATDAKSAGAGTVYRETAANRPGRGTAWVNHNNFLNTLYTDVPPFTNYIPGELNWAVCHVTNGARLRLTNDFVVGDIRLDSANTMLDLGFRTLTVRSAEHALGLGTVTNYGAIVWAPPLLGTVVVLQ